MKQVFKIVREPTIRNGSGENYTLGRMYLDNVFLCHTCEDEDRFLENKVTEKVYGRTAIPRGKYVLQATFSNRFKKVLPLVVDVPAFAGIRIHGGNTAEDSLGCILVGSVRTSSGIAKCGSMVQLITGRIEQAEDIGTTSELVIE